MQCMGLAMGLSTPSVSGRKAYEGLFDSRMNASNVETLGVLFLDVGTRLRSSSRDISQPLRWCRRLNSVVYHLCNIET